MNTQLPDNGGVSGAIYRPVKRPGVRGATPGPIPRRRLCRTSTHRRLSGHRFGRYSSRSQSFAYFSIDVTLPYPGGFVNPQFCRFLSTFGSLTCHRVGSIIIATGRGNRRRVPPRTASLVQPPRPAWKKPEPGFHRQKVALGNQPPTSASKLYSAPPGRDGVPPGAPVIVPAVGCAGARGGRPTAIPPACQGNSQRRGSAGR